MPRNRKAVKKAAKTSDTVNEALKQAVERVIARYKTLGELKSIVGCSVSTLSAWRKGKTQLSLDDSISMGLLDTEAAGLTDYDRACYWIRLCGHESRLDDPKLKLTEEIEKRTSLGARLTDALNNIKAIARARGRGISDGNFRLAFSCYLGQSCLKDDINKWTELSHGRGTMAYIWRWNPHICKRFETEVLKVFVQSLLQQPPVTVTGKWKPPTQRSQIRVAIYLQMNVAGTELSNAMAQLRVAVASFVDDLALRKEDRSRFSLFTTTQRFPHPADCCVFTSPPPGKTFGVLVSESSELVEAMESSDDPEIKANPYAWSGQIIHLNRLDHNEGRYKAGLSVIQGDYLEKCSITLKNGELKHESNWKQFDFSER